MGLEILAIIKSIFQTVWQRCLTKIKQTWNFFLDIPLNKKIAILNKVVYVY